MHKRKETSNIPKPLPKIKLFVLFSDELWLPRQTNSFMIQILADYLSAVLPGHVNCVQWHFLFMTICTKHSLCHSSVMYNLEALLSYLKTCVPLK
jgi:hypothetical protein